MNKLYSEPFVSIIVCTYNGSKKIGKSLQSLFNQNFPRDKYEVIVVDDGSIDNTFEVVSKFPIVLVKHKKNKGLAAARNTGLMKSRGEIVICYDDDCTADKNWLVQLVKAYDDKMVMGAGGLVALPKHPALTDEYCFNSGYGSPVPVTLGRSKSIFIRFWNYLITNFSHPQSKYTNGTVVYELPGILSSFIKSKIVAIGGWNETLVNIAEDIDLCRRLKQKYPNSYFVVMSSSKVIHEQKLSFYKFLKKEFQRGRLRKKYYTIKKETPPYFPFPFVFIFMTLFILAIMLPIFIILVIPFILYPWWIFRAITEKNIKMFLYPYLQLLHEGSTVLGMLI